VTTPPDSIARNTGFSLAVRLGSAAFTAGLTLFLVRYLGPDDYGVFALALGVGLLVLIPSGVGIPQAAARFVADHRGKPDDVAAVIDDALVLRAAVGAGFSIALAAFAGPIANAYGSPDLEWPLRIMALAVLGQGMLLLYASLFEALGRVVVYLQLGVAESALEAGASVAFVLLGGGAAGAMWGRAAAYIGVAVLGLALLARTVGRRSRPRPLVGRGFMRRIAGYGSALVVVDGAFTLFTKIDVLLIGAILSVESVGLFDAPARLIFLLGYAGLAASSGVAPRIIGPDGRPDRQTLESALRWLIVLQGLALAPLLVWAGPIADTVLGDDYAKSADVLRGLAPYALLLAISPLLAGAVNYLGEARRRVPIAIATVLLNLAIDLALLSPIGIVAGAIGTDVAYLLYVGAHFRIVKELVGVRLAPLGRTFLRILAAAGAMAGVLLAFGTSDVSLPALVAGGALGILAYAAVLVAMREVSPEELRRASGVLRAARGRLRAEPGRG
jgi:O-antigen/teichoic acid export membrane protein